MSKKNSQDDGDDIPTAPFWMTTYSDMVTLLLTFFVMIVAMSEVEVKKFKEALSYFQGSTGVLSHESVLPISQVTTRKSSAETRKQAEQHEKLIEQLKAQDLEDKVQVNLTERGFQIVITDSVMFNSGRARLIEPSRTVLRLLSGLIDDKVQSVIVEGHTDDNPIHTEQFPSNWELSTARAASVVRFLQQNTDALPPSSYVPIGYGSYHPVAPNKTAAGRARNRRVEILFSWKPWRPKATTPKTKFQNP